MEEGAPRFMEEGAPRYPRAVEKSTLLPGVPQPWTAISPAVHATVYERKCCVVCDLPVLQTPVSGLPFYSEEEHG